MRNSTLSRRLEETVESAESKMTSMLSEFEDRVAKKVKISTGTADPTLVLVVNIFLAFLFASLASL